ncbi:MAG: prolyl oligopeptidase family serine peptidase [Gammaproteobacteria bacterium]
MILRLGAFCATATFVTAGATAADTPDYPHTKEVSQVDTYHGVEVEDPYRWLEQDVRESTAVREWVEAQNEVTFAWLESLPQRDRIERRLTELWDYEKFDVPFEEGGRYFFFRNDGLQNQSVLYTQASLDAEPEMLIDPNTWSEDGTIALSGVAVSEDARYLAYGIQDGGTDWRIWRVMDLKARKLLDDELRWLKFTNVDWSKDGSGFYYSRYPATGAGAKFQSLNLDQKVYHHRLGTPQSEDRLVHATPEHPKWSHGAQVTEDGKYLVITSSVGTDERYRVAWKDLTKPDAKTVTLIDKFEHDYTLAGSEGDVLYFRTNRDAPLGRLVAIDLNEPDPEDWREVVPEQEHVLESAELIGGHLVAQYLRDAHAEVKVYDTRGKLVRTVELPGIGAVEGFEGEADDPETFYSYSSFNTPPTTYRYDVSSGKSTVLHRPEVRFDPDDYAVEQTFCRSKDGTQVPVFLAYRKGLARNGDNPTLLYGYGGFNISVTPEFSISRLAWMEMGGLYAVANLRGGGEYGEAWHQAGAKLNKQNVFDDFIAAAECLIDKDYTRPERLGIFGRSNGGLLVGAVLNQRPDLFGAALPAVGVMDMLRFDEFTAGRFWVDDYGSSENAEQFEALYAYSPYHNIEEGEEYPPVLVTTADTDDRVVPGHSFKYVAALQEAQAGEEPVLIRIETRAGHGSGKPTTKLIEEYADEWAFLAHSLDLKLPKRYGHLRGTGPATGADS